MKTAPEKPADLSAQIAKAIRDAIMSGALPVDERLPSEAELAEQFAVSRPTVREALKLLTHDSLVVAGRRVDRLRHPEHPQEGGPRRRAADRDRRHVGPDQL